LPSDRSVHIGIVVTNGCERLTAFEAGLSSGAAAIAIPEVTVGDDCSETAVGYAFAYVQDDTTVPVGDPLLEAAAIESPWVTLVPVRVQLPGAGAPQPSSGTDGDPTAGEILGIRCPRDGLTTEIDRNVVRAGREGVAIMTSLDGSQVQLVFDVGRGDRFFLSDTPRAVNLPPGIHTVSCVYEGDIVSESRSFEVIDPDGQYVDPMDHCTPNGFADFEPLVVDDPSQLESAAARVLGVDRERIVPAGYVASLEERLFMALVRTPAGSSDAARVVWFRHRDDRTWISTSIMFCGPG
jgi:hypothetical protein